VHRGQMEGADGKKIIHSANSRSSASGPDREHLNRGAKDKIPNYSLVPAATHHILVGSQN